MTLMWRDLFLMTLRTPADAAEVILAQDIPRRELYMALVAGAALNTVITGLTLMISPLPEGWPSFIGNPMTYFVLAVGGLLLFAHLLTWSGRALGGSGGLDEMLKLMIWVQYVRIVLQTVGVVLSIAVPVIAGLYSLVMTALSLWIVLHFISVGHRLAGLGRGAMVLFVTFVGLIVGLSLVLALLGGAGMGVNPNV